MFYTHAQLDRADRLRKDEQQQAALMNRESSQLLPVWRGKLMVGVGENNQTRMLSIPVCTNADNQEPMIFLGLVDGNAVFTQSISGVEESGLNTWTNLATTHNANVTNIRFEDLRVTGPALPAKDGALMAYARGLVYWHDTQRFCSLCGSPLHSVNAGHIKCCNNSECNHQSFPRTDPAVIMLVTKEASEDSPALCLLGRNKAWPTGVYSTLAGFVEPGESLEQAVTREVFEEANITTENVRYIASQPWPFPRSIMLGFEASATSTTIQCDPTELEDAQWFTLEQLEQFGTWGDEIHENQLPRTDSIARFLIDRWMTEQKEG